MKKALEALLLVVLIWLVVGIGVFVLPWMFVRN